jgi:hypothetical protein
MVVADADTWPFEPARPLDAFLATGNGESVVFGCDAAFWLGAKLPLSTKGLLECREWLHPNAGFFAIRNNRLGRSFMETWMHLGRGELAHISDEIPRDQFVLWRGMFRRWRKHIRMDDCEVVRVTSNFHWRMLKRTKLRPLVMHDKRLTMEVS